MAASELREAVEEVRRKLTVKRDGAQRMIESAGRGDTYRRVRAAARRDTCEEALALLDVALVAVEEGEEDA